MSYTQEQIDRANQVNLEQFLRSQGEKLIKSGREYRWKKHDSLTINGNRWFRHSQNKGGFPLDFVMEFYDKTFPEAVEMLLGEKPMKPVTQETVKEEFRLPPFSMNQDRVKKYLTKERNLPLWLVEEFIENNLIYEDAKHQNVVFVGRDENGIPRYAHCRGIADNSRRDVTGSDKSYGFCYRGKGTELYVFEAAIDLLSHIALYPAGWKEHSYLSLGGVSPKALERFLSEREDIESVFIATDNDEAGNNAAEKLAELLPKNLSVYRLLPQAKDWNEELINERNGLKTDEYITIGVRKPQDSPKTVPMIRMSDVEQTEVDWLWYPYIPFGKLTIIQGNPGEGKTFFAMQLAAACTNQKFLPEMEPFEPFNMIFQTAEDGLGDTVKPRLIEAAADLDRVLVIDEAKRELTLSDERIEKAITQNGARLIILDPIQAYMGEKTDMNRANEVRPIFRRLAEVAERTGCAVILIGHLNKAAGGQSAYRGLGSIDFRAAARSVLLIGRVKREPNVRVVIHDKSSLAPEGKPVAFCLDPETGFEWIGEYDITADELLSGAGGNNATKTEQAERLILDLLADGKELASEDIEKAATEAGISARTVRAAKRNLDGRITSKRIGAAWYHALKK